MRRGALLDTVPSSSSGGRAVALRWWRGGLATLASALMIVTGLSVPVAASAAGEDAAISLRKAIVGTQTVFSPGDTFEYEIEAGCSSPISGICVDLELTDVLPEPLVFNPGTPNPVIAVNTDSTPVTVAVDHVAQSFSASPTNQGSYEGNPVSGLTAGQTVSITVSVMVPTTAGGEWNGATVTNTVEATAENAPDVNAPANITLDVETTLVAAIDKSVSATVIPAVPGRPVDWTVVPGNNSNQPVDTITVQDPAVAPWNLEEYLDFTGFDLEAPEGTTGETVEYFTAGAWSTSAPDPLSLAEGLRVTFIGTFAPGAAGELTIRTVTNDAVTEIPSSEARTVNNDAIATVGKGVDTSPVVDADASVTIIASNPDVAVTKQFDDNTLVSGQSAVATITATNGVQDVRTLTIREPSASQPSFTEQGLAFDGFGDDIEWPVGATAATITYTGAGCASTPQTTTTVDTLPAAANDCVVDGFVVTFEAASDDIVASGYATLPLKVTALPRAEPTTLSSVNHVDVEVVNTSDQHGTNLTEAPFTIQPLIVDTLVSKNITPAEVWGLPGADASISLSGKVTDDSTVGAEYLLISDPIDPTTGSGAAFWQAFRPTEIDNTDIAACSTLTLNYWSTSNEEWLPLPGATDIAGPVSGYRYEIPASITDIGGIQYLVEPNTAESGCANTLPPGFVLLTNIDVELTGRHTVESTLLNDVRSQVDNENSVVREPTDDDNDSVLVKPIDGIGPDFVDKHWLNNDVLALSRNQRTARLAWSTAGLNVTTMTLTDPSTAGQLTNVSTSVYDAFDLVAIPAISTEKDPLIAHDRITKVELYSASAGAWVDITSAACANGCDGMFGGYALTTAEADDTLGVRVTLTEREPGAGIGSSYDRRPFDLTFRVRDTLRSNPSAWVLGNYHTGTYNTGEAGVVENTVNAHGVGPNDLDHASSDSDTITIMDAPVNVSLTKVFDQDNLGLPASVPLPSSDEYPLITARITATNQSASRVSSIEITDPDPAQVAPTAYDVLNLANIDIVTVPTGLTLADAVVTLLRESGPPTTYTGTDAEALTPAELADVISFSVQFRNASGSPVIMPNAIAAVDLTWQLRSTKRSGGPVAVTSPGGVPIVNQASTFVDSPGRIACDTPETPGCSSGRLSTTDEFNIVEASYAIQTTKSINPASVSEAGSKRYTTQLTGQSLGTARTTLFTLADDTPTFWNTMDFVGMSITVPRPVNQLRLDVLVGATYVLDADVLVAQCAGVPVTPTSDCWVAGDWTTVTPGGAATLSLPAGVTASDVVGVQVHARRIDGSGAPVQWERPYNPRLNYTLLTDRREFTRSDPSLLVSTTRPDLAPNPGETERGEISNEVVATSTGQFGANQVFTVTEKAPASTLVVHQQNAISVTKTRGTQPTVNPANLVNYIMVIRNTGQWDMTGFEVTDQIGLIGGSSPLVEPSPTAYTFSISGTGAPSGSAGFSASLDEATGELAIVNSDPDFVFRSGWTLTVTAPLKFRDGLSTSVWVENSVTATSDRLFERCDSTTQTGSGNPTSNPQTTNVADCSATASVTPRASATVQMKKWVKGDEAGVPGSGDDDLGVLNATGSLGATCNPEIAGVGGVFEEGTEYFSYPCAPITRPGGDASWRLDFTNTGNTNAKVIASVDTLPAVGDTGVILTSPRGSQFPVTLVGAGAANTGELIDGAHATVAQYGSTSVQSQACNTNAIEVYTAAAAPNASCAFDWQPITAASSEAELAGIRTVLTVVSFADQDAPSATPGLHPGETLELTLNTRTPWVLPASSAVANGTPVAYNSFAGSSRSVPTATQPERSEFVLEPQRVGIATALGQLSLSKDVVAPDFTIDLPSTYPMLVTCTSGDQPVVLVSGTGADTSRPSLPGDGSTVVFGTAVSPITLPLFADCSVTEDPVPTGASVSITPSSVVAQRDLSTNPGVWNPYQGPDEAVVVEITNTFTAGSFTVRKAVDDSGAVDQDGEPIVYDEEYEFAVSCVYDSQQVIPEDERTFALAQGESAEFTAIPTGSECSVTETDRAGAASTTFVVTGATESETSASSAEFTSVAGDITVDVTNVYEVGALQITKEIIGTGADTWGAGPFSLTLVCTIDSANPTTVYDGDLTVSAAVPVITVQNIPAGADCVVTETDDAGATAATLTPVDGRVTITADSEDTAEVTVTNDFRTGAFQVRKEVAGPGAPEFSNGPFVFTAVCTYEGAEAFSTEITLTGDGSGDPLTSAVYGGIPVGAECLITEIDDAHADETPAPVTITIEDQDPIGTETVVTAGLINEFSAGTASLEKLLDGAAAEEPWATEATFTVLVTCQIERDDTIVTLHSASYEIVGGELIAVTDDDGNPVLLPLGTHCFIEETDDAGATSAAVNFDSFENAAVIEVAGDEQLLELVATNSFEYAEFSVEKTISGTAASDAGGLVFEIAVACTFEDATLLQEVVEIRGGETIVFDQLPAGAECTVQESNTRGADGVSVTVDGEKITGTLARIETVFDEPVLVAIDNRFDAKPATTGAGNNGTLAGVGAGLALLLLGAGAYGLRRRRNPLKR